MGTSVISPMIFYWISVLSTLKIALGLGIGGAICAIIVNVAHKMCESDTALPDRVVIDEINKRIKVWVKCLVFFIVMFIFTPNEDTMIKMLVADMITYENIELTKESAMALVDYIVEQVKAITG